MAKKSIDSWIREAVIDPDKEGPISAMSMCHIIGNGGETEIHLTKFVKGRVWEASELAGMFVGKAETYSQDLSGVQTFRLSAFYNGDKTASAFHPFTVSGNTDLSLTTEGPDKQGETMQSMRHREAMTQGMMKERAHLLDKVDLPFNMLVRAYEITAKRLETVERENIDALTLVKEIFLERDQQQHAREMEREKYRRATKDREIFLKLVPAFANRLTDGKMFPQSTEDTLLIDTIAENLTPDMVQGLQSILPPQLAGLVSARLKKTLESKEKIDAISTRLPDETEEDISNVGIDEKKS